MERLRVTETCAARYAWIQFGFCFVKGLRLRDDTALRAAQANVEASLRTDHEEVLRRAKDISRCYRQQHEKSRSHIESLIKAIANGKTIKPVNFIVDGLMVAELTHGLPMGVHDLEKTEGDLVLDIAVEGETFVGIGGRTVTTRDGEIVLRDDQGIWASYTQGPDQRTLVDETTRNALLLGFFTPETTREHVEQGLAQAVSLLLTSASGEVGELHFVDGHQPVITLTSS